METSQRIISSVVVEGILGEYKHELHIPADTRTSILYGPNGVGKTKFLEIINAATKPDPWTLWHLPFERAIITYSDKYKLIIEFSVHTAGEENNENHHLRGGLLIQIKDPQEQIVVQQDFNDLDDDTWISRRYPVRRISNDLWEDMRTGDIISTEELRSKAAPDNAATSINDKIREFCSESPTFLIETQRLQRSHSSSPFERYSPRLPPSAKRPPSRARIQEQADLLQQLIHEAHRQHSYRTQKLDRSFPGRALRREIEVKYNQDEVLRRYEEQNSFRRRLSAITSRLRSDHELSIPADLTPQELRLLNLYLDDADDKLSPFRVLLAKIDILENALNARLLNKEIHVNDSNGLSVTKKTTGETIKLTDLSSGEQHEVILMTDLLFNAPPGSLVLIDEPEISLHVAWQVRFIQDVERIAQECNFNFVVATHSPQIINDRWDQAHRLGPTDAGFLGSAETEQS